MTSQSVDCETVDGELFYRLALDALVSQIVILNADGEIIAANESWTRSVSGDCDRCHRLQHHSNYFQACQRALIDGVHEAAIIVAGIRDVLAGKQELFQFEYPDPGHEESNWFCVRVTRFEADGDTRIVVAHDDISRQKQAEMKLQEMKRILEMEAATDVLTGLANRRGLNRTLEQEWKRNQRTQTPLSLAVLDVDHFKEFNDHYGHLAGDDCLRRLAGVIKANMRRPGDFAARYGGEEFAVILPGTNESGAATVLTNILEAVRRLEICHPATTVRQGIVTVSIGCATTLPQRFEIPDSLLMLADKALYAAKSHGRDQLICALQMNTMRRS